MALGNKVYNRIYENGGSGTDALTNTEQLEFKRQFDDNEYIVDENFKEAFGVILYAIQSLSEDIDEIRRYADPTNGNQVGDLGKIMSAVGFDSNNNIELTNTTIPLSQIANIATDKILGRTTANSGNIEEISPTSLRTMINVADGANAYVHPNHSGDVTSSADGATTIGNDKVTYAKMQNVTNARMLGNNAGSSGDVTEMTKANVLSFLNVADGATADQTNVTGSSGSCTGNAATATALTSGNKTISGDLTVTSGTSGDATLIISSDTDNNEENDHPRLWFKQDGDITAGAIQLDHNELEIISNHSSDGGISFWTGTTDNTGTTDPKTSAVERMAISSVGVVSTTGDMTVGGALTATGGITNAGIISAGTWNGTAIASNKLDPDTAHLSGIQTFLGPRTFEAGIVLDGDRSVTPGDGTMIHVDTSDITDNNTSATGTATAYNHVSIENPRLMASNNAVTTTDASTLQIKGAPVASTNQTITNAWALKVTAGNCKFGGDLDVTGNVLPGLTHVKILPSDFIPDDGGRPVMIDDSTSRLWVKSHGTLRLYASVQIPEGFKVTHVDIYGDGTSQVTVYEADIDDSSVVSKGTGSIGTQIDITDVTANATNYILIRLEQGSAEKVYGGKLTIAKA